MQLVLEQQTGLAEVGWGGQDESSPVIPADDRGLRAQSGREGHPPAEPQGYQPFFSRTMD